MNFASRFTRYLLTWAAFAVIGLGAVLALKSRRPPPPAFVTMARDQPEQFIEFEDAKPAVVAFSAQSPHLRGAWFHVLFPDKKNPIRLTAKNQTSGEKLGENLVGFGTRAEIEFDGPIAVGDRIEVKFEVTVPKPWKPKLKRIKSGYEPLAGREIQVSVGGEVVSAAYPPMVLHYRSGWKWLLWLWVVVAAAIPGVLRKPGFIWPWFVILGICCFVTSWHGWTQRYGTHLGHMDPDRYGAASTFLVEWLKNPEKRDHYAANLRDYQHAHVALAPSILAGMQLAGFQMHDAYVLLNILVSFATVLLVHHLLRHQLRLSEAISLLGVLAFATHIIFLRAYARPTTDQLGLLLVTAMLCLLVERLERRTPRQTLALALLVAPLVFVRPPGFVYAAFLISMAPFCDVLRERRLDLRDHLLTFAKIAALPMLAVFIIYARFDLFHNFDLAREKSKQFHNQWAWEWFWRSALFAGQLFVVGWGLLGFRARAKTVWRPALVLGTWMVLHTLLLVVAQAPFIARLFAPIVPSVVALACMGLDGIRDFRVRAGFGAVLLGLTAAANVGVQLWALNLPGEPMPGAGWWFYW